MIRRFLTAFALGALLNALAVSAQVHTFEFSQVTIQGDLHALSYTGNGAALTGVTGIASGLIFWANLAACPTGWTAVSMGGLAAVGVPNAGTITASVGTALTNLENRAVGTHNHTASTVITDPGHKPVAATSVSPNPHSHTLNITPRSSFGGTGDVAFQQAANTTVTPATLSVSTTITNTTTGITIGTTLANAGSVAGTNLPYIQELMCKKN